MNKELKMNFFSNVIESLFFKSDSMKYWSAPLYGLNSLKGKAPNITDPQKPEISFEILIPKESQKLKKDRNKDLPAVLFFQSAQFNMSFSMQQVAFLALDGIPVVLFDYEGVGETAGEAHLETLDKDAASVWNSVKNSEWIKGRKLFLFGQGIGADAALRFYLNHKEEVDGMILESVYATQKGFVAEKHGLLLGDLMAKALSETEIQPAQAVSSVTCPLVVVYPEKDNFVRKGQRRLFEFSLPKQAEIWNVPGKNFLCVFADNNSPFREKLTKFIKNDKKS